MTDGIHRLSQEQWWTSVRKALDTLADDDLLGYHAEVDELDHAAGNEIDVD